MPFSVFSAFRRVDPLRWARTTSSRATAAGALIASFHKFPLYLPQALQNERRRRRSNFARICGQNKKPERNLAYLYSNRLPNCFCACLPAARSGRCRRLSAFSRYERGHAALLPACSPASLPAPFPFPLLFGQSLRRKKKSLALSLSLSLLPFLPPANPSGAHSITRRQSQSAANPTKISDTVAKG